MRDGFFGSARDHAFELRDRAFGVALALVIDAEIEPGVRQGRVLALHFFEKFDCLRLAAFQAQQGKRVVQLVAGGIRGDFDACLNS